MVDLSCRIGIMKPQSEDDAKDSYYSEVLIKGVFSDIYFEMKYHFKYELCLNVKLW